MIYSVMYFQKIDKCSLSKKGISTHSWSMKLWTHWHHLHLQLQHNKSCIWRHLRSKGLNDRISCILTSGGIRNLPTERLQLPVRGLKCLKNVALSRHFAAFSPKIMQSSPQQGAGCFRRRGGNPQALLWHHPCLERFESEFAKKNWKKLDLPSHCNYFLREISATLFSCNLPNCNSATQQCFNISAITSELYCYQELFCRK